MIDLYMVEICHIPTLHHYDIFPPGGNMTGGNDDHDDHNHDADHGDHEHIQTCDFLVHLM